MTLFTRTAKDNPERASENFPLPDGHDDAEGPFYVPDFAHEAWGKHAGSAPVEDYNLLHRTMRVLALYRFRKERYPESFTPTTRREMRAETEWDPRTSQKKWIQSVVIPSRYAPHMLQTAAETVLQGRDNATEWNTFDTDAGEWADRELGVSGEEIRREAEHSIRLAHVGARVREEQAKSKADREHRQQYQCPVCGLVDERQGQPELRNLIPGAEKLGSNLRGRYQLLSCAACYFDALGELMTRFSDQQCGEYPRMHSRREMVAAHLNAKGI